MEQEDGEKKDDEGGCFLLESLGTSDSVSIESVAEDLSQESSGVTPRAVIRPKIVQVNTAKALREVRENQRKMEKKIAIFTCLIVIIIAVTTTILQTDLLDGGLAGARSKTGIASLPVKINCGLAENKNNEACVLKRNKESSSWKSLERSASGPSAHFSLNGM